MLCDRLCTGAHAAAGQCFPAGGGHDQRGCVLAHEAASEGAGHEPAQLHRLAPIHPRTAAPLAGEPFCLNPLRPSHTYIQRHARPPPPPQCPCCPCCPSIHPFPTPPLRLQHPHPEGHCSVVHYCGHGQAASWQHNIADKQLACEYRINL